MSALTPAVFHFLLALAGGDRHGYGIMQDVAAHADGAVRLCAGTLYGTIQRLMDSGAGARGGVAAAARGARPAAPARLADAGGPPRPERGSGPAGQTGAPGARGAEAVEGGKVMSASSRLPRAMAVYRAAERTFNGTGYDRQFIGVNLPLPVPRTQTVRRDLVGADGERLAHYTHFSLSIRKSRRMAAFVAWNVDGHVTKPSTKNATWQIDPRVPPEYQIDNALYEGTKFDRGHIAKREDLLWGGKSVAKQANDDSFCYTNATPQHEKFNRLAPALWKSLEDELFRQVDVADSRIALVGGPIFSKQDRPFVPPGAPAGFKPVLIPRQFFKVVAYRDQGDNRVKAMAFRLSQESLVGGRSGAAASGKLDLSRFHMYQVDVAEIEALTGLNMAAFRQWDTKAAHDRLAPKRLRQADRPIHSFADILR